VRWDLKDDGKRKTEVRTGVTLQAVLILDSGETFSTPEFHIREDGLAVLHTTGTTTQFISVVR